MAAGYKRRTRIYSSIWDDNSKISTTKVTKSTVSTATIIAETKTTTTTTKQQQPQHQLQHQSPLANNNRQHKMKMQTLIFTFIGLVGVVLSVGDDGDLISAKPKIIFPRIPFLPPFYEISFDIKPLGEIDGVSSVLHVIGKVRHGYRTVVSVWFEESSSRLRICSAINKNRNYCWSAKYNTIFYQYSHVTISQKVVHGKLLFQIIVNKEILFEVENRLLRTFKSVKVFSPSPIKHIPAAHTMVNNVKVKNLFRDYLPWYKRFIKLLHLKKFNRKH